MANEFYNYLISLAQKQEIQGFVTWNDGDKEVVEFVDKNGVERKICVRTLDELKQIIEGSKDD